MSDALALLLRLNLAMAVAVAAALLLRHPARRMFGATVAYGLWALVPLAAVGVLVPGRVVTLTSPSAAAPAETATLTLARAAGSTVQLAPGLNLHAILLAIWATGAALALVGLALRQAQFHRAVLRGVAGPAVIGVFRPRIVTPTDFTQRYTPREQQVVLAHEATHILRQDSRINALVAVVRCLYWFNPLAYALAHYLRIDQELACDAQVIAAHPAARRSYAEAMLKTQLAVRPLPLGCYWPSASVHPLAERIGLLSRKDTSRTARRLGGATVALLCLGAACAAWAARPAEVVWAPETAMVPTRAAPGATLAPPRPTQPLRQISAHQADPPTPDVESGSLPAPRDDSGAYAADDPPRLLPSGLFGPPRPLLRIRSAARWSTVEPGSAVRVLATMIDPEGAPLTTDLTAFGSQSYYRLGYVQRRDSRYKLFTGVVQRGDKLIVTAGLNHLFDPLLSGSVELRAGETGKITLGDGEVVTVTPTIRAETPQEVADGKRRGYVRIDRISQDS